MLWDIVRDEGGKHVLNLGRERPCGIPNHPQTICVDIDGTLRARWGEEVKRIRREDRTYPWYKYGQF